MSEQDKLLKDLKDILIKYLAECMVGGAVPLELADIRARDILAKAEQHYEPQIKEHEETIAYLEEAIQVMPECFEDEYKQKIGEYFEDGRRILMDFFQGEITSDEALNQIFNLKPRSEQKRLDRLPIGQRVLVKELNVSGWIYESTMPERGTTETDRIYGVRLDKTAFPKNFVATEVWHCPLDGLDLLDERLDRPKLRKLRKKIAKGLYVSVLANMEAFAVIVPMPWEKLTPEAREKWCTEADQILALIPDIEDLVTKLKQAVKDARDGKDIDLPEELYEVFCSIQNQTIIEAKREERERIESLFDSEPTHCTFVKTQSVEECYVIRVKDWQALGEK